MTFTIPKCFQGFIRAVNNIKELVITLHSFKFLAVFLI